MNRTSLWRRLLQATSLFAWLVAAPVSGQSPVGTAFTFQGELTQSGSPATSADLIFRLYDAVSGGTLVAGPFVPSTPPQFDQGRFTIILDFGPGAFGPDERWVEIEARVPAGGPGAFTTLTPRQLVTPAPVSLFAINAAAATNATQLNGQAPSFYQNAANLSSGTIPDARLAGTYSGLLSLSNAGNTFSGSGAGLVGLNASNLSAGTLADARLSGNVALRNAANAFTSTNTFAGNVGIGTTTPTYRLTVMGGAATGGYFETNGADRSGVFALNTLGAGFAHGVYGQSNSTSGDGVFGIATAATGVNYGGRFQSAGTGGNAVHGVATSATGFSVGGHFRSQSTSGTGVLGTATATSGVTFGGRFENSSTTGTGVYGVASAASGVTFGGAFQNASTDGRGVQGFVSASTGVTYGVVGDVVSTGGVGVYGLAAAATGNTYGGHFVSRSPTGVGGYFRNDAGGVALLADGLAQVRVLQILGGSDLAEPFDVAPVADVEPAPGMVVVINESRPGKLRICDRAYDSKVAGVLSGANGLSPGMVMRAAGQEHADGKHPVALTGRVWVYVDTAFGAITPGDRLTTSATPGHAMRVEDTARSVGTVIGKAMTELNEGKGLVLVLVNLQ